MKNFQAYVENMENKENMENTENMSGNSSNQKALPDKSKSMKIRSFNFRSLMKEGSKRFLPATVAAAERRGNPEEISSNGDQVV